MMMRESVSFGRFESDPSLAWERWSVFSRNRLMEEVQKYAVPGSVAEKKAYFDAHYNRKRAHISTESLTVAENYADSGAAADPPAANAQESEIYVDETSEGWNKVDLCEERSGSSGQNCSVSETSRVSDGRCNMVPAASDLSQDSCDMFEDENQTTSVELHTSNKSGSQPLKENFDINKEVSIADSPKKASSVVGLPKKSRMTVFKKEDYVTPDGKRPAILGTPMKHSVSPARHVKTRITVPKKEYHATPNSKGLGSCIPKFRNKAAINVEGVEPRTPIDKNATRPTKLSFSWNRNDRSGFVNVRSSTIEKIAKVKSVTGFFRASYCAQSQAVCLITKEPPSNRTGSATKTIDSREKGGIRASCENLAMTFRLRTEERAAKRKEFYQKLEEKAKAEEAKKMQYRNKNKKRMEAKQHRGRRSVEMEGT